MKHIHSAIHYMRDLHDITITRSHKNTPLSSSPPISLCIICKNNRSRKNEHDRNALVIQKYVSKHGLWFRYKFVLQSITPIFKMYVFRSDDDM